MRRKLLILLTVALIVAIVWVMLIFKDQRDRAVAPLQTEYQSTVNAIENR